MQRRRILTLAAAVVAALTTTVGVAAAQGPLPGWTIFNPPLPPIQAGGQPTTVRQGVYEHAAFDFEVPAHWNGQLVLWAHGYRGASSVLTVDPPAYGLRQTFVNEGYAWAASSYYDNAYDVAAGVTTTHDLAQHVAAFLPHVPSRTYITGVSMGGQIIGRSLEQYPKYYAGALPMCGVLGDNRLFDYFLDYNLTAQDLAGVRAYPPTSTYFTQDVPRIEAALGIAGAGGGNALGDELRRVTVSVSGGARPGTDAAFAYWKNFLFAIATPPNPGPLSFNPARVSTNVGHWYTPNSPVNLNATIQRVAAADPVSRRSLDLTQIPRIVGNPQVPVLTLHGIGDLFVPFSMEQIYNVEVGAHRQSDLLVQRAIREAGHCEYTPVEVGRAWSDLQKWVQTGARPAGDNVFNPDVIASPTYGCTFTDPKGYNDPFNFPTRSFYPRCPAA